MKQVWGFGSACVDIRLTTADYGPAYTTKLLAQETRLQGGGACANCLTQVARLGGRAAWLGKVGDDALGALILRQLQEERVDTSHALVAPNALSPFNVAVYAGTQWRRVVEGRNPKRRKGGRRAMRVGDKRGRVGLNVRGAAVTHALTNHGRGGRFDDERGCSLLACLLVCCSPTP